jgi:predicted flap endonuclease-1-like 5' DNA nuclease
MAPLAAFVLGGAVGYALGELCGVRPSAAEIEEFSEVLGRALLAARQPTEPRSTEPRSTEPQPEQASPAPSLPRGRSLHDIEGIDDALAARLVAAGIPNLAVLAQIDLERVEIPGVGRDRLKRWKTMARLLQAMPRLLGNDAELLVTGVGVDCPEDLEDVNEEVVRDALDRVELPEDYDVERLLELLAEFVVI